MVLFISLIGFTIIDRHGYLVVGKGDEYFSIYNEKEDDLLYLKESLARPGFYWTTELDSYATGYWKLYAGEKEVREVNGEKGFFVLGKGLMY